MSRKTEKWIRKGNDRAEKRKKKRDQKDLGKEKKVLEKEWGKGGDRRDK